MAGFEHFKDHHAETRLFRWRLAAAVVIMLIMLGALVSRMLWLQVIQHNHYSTLSDHNRIQIRPIAPPRGLILDREGRILAANKSVLSVSVVPEQVDDMSHTLAAIGKLIELTPDTLSRFKKRLTAPRRPWEPVPLRSRLSDKEAAKLAAAKYRLPGVNIKAEAIRYYPYSKMLSHVIGYVSRITQDDLSGMAPNEQENYRGTHYYGQTGLERYYEKRLHGKVGYRRTVANARGRQLRVLGETPPVRGKNLQLYLDLDVQKAAWDALGQRSGAVVAIDPRSGGVLALVSRPGFNTNLFVTGISYDDYNAIRNNPQRPLFDRALQGQYPPGSTIKPFMGLAALYYGVTTWDRTIQDPGFFQLPTADHIYHDWRRWGHGTVDLRKAIKVSCDTYFYTMGHELGIHHIDAFLSQFKFGQKSGIDLFGESNGILPSPTWKYSHRATSWYAGDTINTSIGQGFWLATPLQLATATAILARDGHTMSPRLADIEGKEQTPVGRSHVLKHPENWSRMRKAMIAVTSDAHGTADYLDRSAPYDIAGKTGTAQVFSLEGEEYNASQLPVQLRDHSLFIAFAPAENPAIVVSVLIEHSAKGLSAASVALKVMNAWLLNNQGKLAIPPAEPPTLNSPSKPLIFPSNSGALSHGS